jgi:LAO/AO transport system kinase
VLPELIKGIRTQTRLAISQGITLIENSREDGQELLENLFQYTGNTYRIGITGPPGAGKSSITNNLISLYRQNGKKVAVIAVDPTSPFSGGALLGDRIRMTSHYSDPHVFVRSMATRGGQGGLSLKSQEVSEVFDAAGFDIIIYETVGVGQLELDVMQASDTVVVVLVPESGDVVQMLKAGLMEIGNIFAINKADRPGANKFMTALNNILTNHNMEGEIWMPQVVNTIATENKGTKKMYNAIESHQTFIYKQGIQTQKMDERYKNCIIDLITGQYMNSFWNDQNMSRLNNELDKEYCKRESPHKLVNELMNL